MNISKDILENITKLEEIFPIQKSYDMITRKLYLGETRAFWLGINGFCKNDLLQRIFSDLQNASYTQDEQIDNLERYVASKIGYIQTETTNDWDKDRKSVV